MTRVKGGMATHRRHRKILTRAKGYSGQRNSLYRKAKKAVEDAGIDAYRGRHLKKRTIRNLWVVRLNAAAKELGLSYSVLMNKLRNAKVILNRKMLAELAVKNPLVFKKVVEKVK